MPPFLQKIIDKSPFLTKVYSILDLYGSRRLGRSAAAFAYYLMLSFFPLLICVASVIGRTRIDTAELLSVISEVIPQQVTETLVTFFGYIHDNYSQAMLWAGIILLLTAASGAFACSASCAVVCLVSSSWLIAGLSFFLYWPCPAMLCPSLAAK